MTSYSEPNPPARKNEDFPKTTTIPDGWVTDSIMASYNRDIHTEINHVLNTSEDQQTPVPATGRSGEETQSTAEENLFTRRLEPFPTASELTGLYL